jgi:hypothetical protein
MGMVGMVQAAAKKALEERGDFTVQST